MACSPRRRGPSRRSPRPSPRGWLTWRCACPNTTSTRAVPHWVQSSPGTCATPTRTLSCLRKSAITVSSSHRLSAIPSGLGGNRASMNRTRRPCCALSKAACPSPYTARRLLGARDPVSTPTARPRAPATVCPMCGVSVWVVVGRWSVRLRACVHACIILLWLGLTLSSNLQKRPTTHEIV